MRIALLMVLLSAGCCTPPLRTADYSSPEATLLTFHNAFQNDNAAREYECLSHPFKQAHGNLNLSTYQDLRRQLRQENPLAVYLFSLREIDDCVVDRKESPDRDIASLFLEVGGQELEVGFLRETIYRIEFDGERPQGDFIQEPLHEILSMEKNRLQLFLPLSRRVKNEFFNINRILVEKQWKILDFSFLKEPARLDS